MPGFVETTDTVEVPSNVGIEGFIRVLRLSLSLPRVQEIRIEANGKMHVRRYTQDEQTSPFGSISFGDLHPSHIIRNTHVEEVLNLDGCNAAECLGELIDRVTSTQLAPLAFVTGDLTSLTDWYSGNTHARLHNRNSLFGIPVLVDIEIPNTALILLAGYNKNAPIGDTQRAYKLEMLSVKPRGNTVEILT